MYRFSFDHAVIENQSNCILEAERKITKSLQEWWLGGQPACWVAAIPAEGGMGESLLLPNSDELKDKNIVVETIS